MPVSRDSNDHLVLQRVLAEYGVSVTDLAALAGLDHSFVSRICSGQYAVPAEVLRAAWRLTGDHRLAAIALGEGAVETIRGGADPQLVAALVRAQAGLSAAGQQIDRMTSGRGDAASARSAVVSAVAALRDLDHRLQTAPPARVDLVA